MTAPRYIVIRDPGLLSTGARMFELRTDPRGSTWKPDPDAPEYEDAGLQGTYSRVRKVAAALNAAEVGTSRPVNTTEEKKACATGPHVTVKAARRPVRDAPQA